MTATKHVVCAWITDAQGRVLITQRKAGTHLEHLWEFPGGKVEPNESEAQALHRELREEIGIDAEIGAELGRVEHEYQSKDGKPWQLELALYAVTRFSGEVRAIDVAAFQWVTRAWLLENEHLLPPADKPLLRSLKL